MKRILLLVTMMTANVFAVERKEVMPLLEEALLKRESAYVEVRNKIIAYGYDVLPLLADLAIDETLSWQQRLLARICYERIEREEDIVKLLATDWYNHHNFKKEWFLLHPGPEPGLGTIIVPDLKETGLWYHYLEVLWKMTGEKASIRHNNSADFWARWCTDAVKDNSEERVWVLRVCSELMVSPPPQWDGWLRSTLFREKKSDSAYLLEHRVPPPVTEEPPFRLGTNIIKRAKQP